MKNAKIFNSSTFEEKFNIIDNDNISNASDEEDYFKSDDDNGLSTGGIIGIICGLLLLIFICGTLIIIFRKKIFCKNNINTEVDNQSNNDEINKEKMKIEMIDINENGIKTEKLF